jgi:hypothetical protein
MATVSIIFSGLSDAAEISVKLFGMMDKKKVPITGMHQAMAATADNTAHTPYPGGELRSANSGRERRIRLSSGTNAHSTSAGQADEHSRPMVRFTSSLPDSVSCLTSYNTFSNPINWGNDNKLMTHSVSRRNW